MQVLKSDGETRLFLPERSVRGWVQLKELILRVPTEFSNLSDSNSSDAYQRVRNDIVSAELEVDQQQLNQYIQAISPKLVVAGIDQLQLRLCGGYIELGARVRKQNRLADISTQLHLSPRGEVLRISCADSKIYGYLETPAPVLAHQILSIVLQSSKHSVVECGLGDFTIKPLTTVLRMVLPSLGWRLPKISAVTIDTMKCTAEGLRMHFRPDGTEAQVPQHTANLLDSLEQFVLSDSYLRKGLLEEALRGYRQELAARGSDDSFLLSRILSIAAASKEHFAEGKELARQILARWPDYTPAHIAIASIDIAQGKFERAADRYQKLCWTGQAEGDQQGSSYAALAGARLLRQFAPTRSTDLYELVQEYHPDHLEASEALASRYLDEHRWADLVRLIRKRIRSTQDLAHQARDHSRLADIMITHLNDPASAQTELLAACALHDSTPSFYEKLADIEVQLGDLEQALSHWEIANSLHKLKNNARAQVLNLIRGGQACLDAKDYETAEAWFLAALDLKPNHSNAITGAAIAATKQDHFEEAASFWKLLVQSDTEPPLLQAYYACELGRSLLAQGEDDEAKLVLEQAVKNGGVRTAAEAYVLLAQRCCSLEECEDALGYLQSAISVLRLSDKDRAHSRNDTGADRRARISDIHLKQAQIHLHQQRDDAALVNYELAFASGTKGSASRNQAAAALLNRSDAAHSKLEWVEELIHNTDDDSELIDLGIRQAAILQASQQPEHALMILETILTNEISNSARFNALHWKAQILDAPKRKAEVLAKRADLQGPPADRILATVECAEAWLAAAEWHRSIDCAQKALQIQGSPSQLRHRALYCLADAAWRARAWQGVDEAYTLLRADNHPIESARSLKWATAIVRMGKSAVAIELLESVVATATADQEIASAYSQLSHLYEQTKEFRLAAEAQEYYAASECCAGHDEQQANAWYRAGELHRRCEHNITEAKRCLGEALHIAPSHLPSLDSLEQIAREQEDFERVAVILGRKIAALSRHPKRQRGLLVRLADVQENILERHDVAQETYHRILKLSPDFRPALEFAQRNAERFDDVVRQEEALQKLVAVLPSDGELHRSEDELQRQREAALLRLIALSQGLYEETPRPIPVAAKTIEVLQARFDVDPDDRILCALQSIYETQNDHKNLAQVIGKRIAMVDDETALPLAIQHISLLSQTIGDLESAHIALQSALKRHPDNERLTSLVLPSTAKEASPTILPQKNEVPRKLQQYRDHANRAAERSDFLAAYDYFDQALQQDASALVLYEEYASVAANAKDYEKSVEQLEAMVSHFPAGEANHAKRGEVLLRLAELYKEHLDTPKNTRRSLSRAAESFPPGEQRNLVLRRLAKEAIEAGVEEEVVQAYERLGNDALTGEEAFQLAKYYHNGSKDKEALSLLEKQHAKGALSLEGQNTLLSLYQARTYTRELAIALHHGSGGAPYEIAVTRLREALRIYRDVLTDEDAVLQVQASLADLGATPLQSGHTGIGDLLRAAESASSAEAPVSATLYSRAMEIHCQFLLATNEDLNRQSYSMLDAVRQLAVAPLLPGQDAKVIETESLVHCLLYASQASKQRDRRFQLLYEVATLRREVLHDRSMAAEELFRAFSEAPGNTDVFAELRTILSDLKMHSLLAKSYELHLASVAKPQRAELLIALGTLHQEIWGEKAKAAEYFSQAKALGAALPPPKVQRPPHSTDSGRPEAAPQETQPEAQQRLEAAAALSPKDPEPLEALTRIYAEQHEYKKLSLVLETLTNLSDSPIERAALFYERANLARSEFHDDVLVYEYLKEAAENAPNDARYTHALRSICMARGQWALAAELTDREIDAENDDVEKGALYLELAMIYDEKLLDASKAVENYEHALALDPEIRSAPRPLAHLYELAGRHTEAFQMYEKAAALCVVPFERGALLRQAAVNAERQGRIKKAHSLYEKVAHFGSVQDAQAAVQAIDRMESPPPSTSSQGQSIEAIRTRLQDETEDSTARAQLFYELGHAYEVDLNDINAAVGAYEDAISSEPDHAKALDALANIVYERRDWQHAYALYKRVPSQMSSLSPAALTFRIAEIAESLGEDEHALELFSKALEYPPENLEGLTGLVRCATRANEHKLAFAAQSKLVSALPVDQVEELSSSRLHLATIAEEFAPLETIISTYEDIVHEEHDSHPALSKLAKLYIEAERSADAIATLQTLLKLTPSPLQRAEFFFDLGELYREANAKNEMAESYFKAIDLAPEHTGTLRRLLYYYCDTGDFESAAEMARDLEKQHSLLQGETGLPLLHRAAIASGLANRLPLLTTIAESLGSGAVEEIARAIRETMSIESPPAPETIAPVLLRLCQMTGDSTEELIERLERGNHEPLKPLIDLLHRSP